MTSAGPPRRVWTDAGPLLTIFRSKVIPIFFRAHARNLESSVGQGLGTFFLGVRPCLTLPDTGGKCSRVARAPLRASLGGVQHHLHGGPRRATLSFWYQAFNFGTISVNFGTRVLNNIA